MPVWRVLRSEYAVSDFKHLGKLRVTIAGQFARLPGFRGVHGSCGIVEAQEKKQIMTGLQALHAYSHLIAFVIFVACLEICVSIERKP